jgi:hypothetical protein
MKTKAELVAELDLARAELGGQLHGAATEWRPDHLLRRSLERHRWLWTGGAATAGTSTSPTRPSSAASAPPSSSSASAFDMAFRIISTRIRTVDELGLPDVVRTLIRYHNGLVLVTGPVGSGKSTTLAALINEINQGAHDHIITLEDPIEYVIESKAAT